MPSLRAALSPALAPGHPRPVRVAVLLLLTLGPACIVEPSGEEFDLRRTPFSNPYVERGRATLEVQLAEGYECPDGSLARIYFIDPIDGVEGRPLALLLHGDNFDYLEADGSSWSQVPKLETRWSVQAVESLLGMDENEAAAVPDGAWVGGLVDAGWSVVAPANCWGDLWHGQGDNPASEPFLRHGAYLAEEALRLAAGRYAAGPKVAIGLGAGGRGVAELLLWPAELAAAVMDGTPDWLPAVLAAPVANEGRIAGLERIWHTEVQGIEDPTARREALRLGLERSSLVHAVEQAGVRTPIIYAWSSQDEHVPAEESRPAAESIAARYGDPSKYLLPEWETTQSAPSNHDPSTVATWLETVHGWIGWAPGG